MRKEPAEVNKGCSNALGCLLMLPILAGGGVYLLLSSPSSTDTANTPPPQVEAPAPPAATGTAPDDPQSPSYTQVHTLKPGTTGRLDLDGQQVLVAKSEDALSQIANDIAVGNTAALEKLESDGDAYTVDDDTSVALIGSDRFLTGEIIYHVRIEGGSHNGDSGWVPETYMRE